MSIFLESKFIVVAVNDLSMVKKEKLLITDESGLLLITDESGL